MKCAGIARSKLYKITYKCAICEKEFTRRTGDYPRKTCSKPCRSIYYRQTHNYAEAGRILGKSNTGKPNLSRRKPPIEKVCKQCGNSFTINRGTAVKQRNNTRFCSSDCWYNFIREHPDSLWNWKGGRLPYYGSNWPSRKREARIRDNFTCQQCGITEKEYGKNLDVHHIKAFRFFGIHKHNEANRLDNLISLCKSCHSKQQKYR